MSDPVFAFLLIFGLLGWCFSAFLWVVSGEAMRLARESLATAEELEGIARESIGYTEELIALLRRRPRVDQ